MPGRPVAFPFGEEHARRIKTQFEALITLARRLWALYASSAKGLATACRSTQRDHQGFSSRERRAQAWPTRASLLPPGARAHTARGAGTCLLSFSQMSMGDTACRPR